MAGNSGEFLIFKGGIIMKRVFVIESVKGVKVNCPDTIYQELFVVGRYTVKALLFPNGGYSFYLFKGEELKAIVGSDDWFISKLDGEGQNLVNRLMKIFG